MDLSKTSKNYNKADNLLKTHELKKNNGKVYANNGKKYETQMVNKSKEEG